MIAKKYFIKTVFLVQILNVSFSSAIYNNPAKYKYENNNGNYKTLETGTFYLNSENPLWILQDQKDERSFKKPFKEKVKYDHIKPLFYHNRQQTQSFNKNYKNFKTKAQNRKTFDNQRNLNLPYNYISVKRYPQQANSFDNNNRRYKNLKFLQNMPVFDAVPGEEAIINPSNPIFIYTGHKGKMLLNTMMSKKKYPMLEPIPGQTLYPPQTLMFKPKPLMENLQRKMNITMIPFYAYEAIDRPTFDNITPTFNTINASYQPPEIITTFQPPKKFKKAKKYSAFYSPQEVLSTSADAHQTTFEYTTNLPLTLEKPFPNHRFQTSTTTTPSPHKKFEVTYNDGDDKFQIIYEDDASNLERPAAEVTTQKPITQSPTPLPYESYKFSNNYFAFPLYTMDNLRQDENRVDLKEDSTPVEESQINSYIDEALKEETEKDADTSKENTWLILNSRYKGPLKSSVTNLHSSKYIQSSPAKAHNNLDFLTITTTAATTKAKLKPQMRSLYGNDVKIVL